MRKIIDWLLLLTLLCAAGYLAHAHRAQIRAAARSIRTRLRPCSSPILYSIGSIDPRFGISTATLAADLNEAEAVWEEPARRNLFEYTPAGGDVTINLVYDSRQAATDRLKALGFQTEQTIGSYYALKARYEALSKEVETAQAYNSASLAVYKAKEAQYNARVQHWNQLGRITPAENMRLNAARASLTRAMGRIRGLGGVINENIDTLNALATTLNQMIVQLNINVAQYNRAGAAIGQYEEGLYRMEGGIQTIDIYEYADRARLVRVLAHELGHALGLEHTPDPEAIMYQVNRAKNLKVSEGDILELNRVCSSGLRRGR